MIVNINQDKAFSPEYEELRTEFFEIIEKDLQVINDFYPSQEAILETRINDLSKKTGTIPLVKIT